MSSVLYDVPGPIGRRRILIGSIIGGLFVLGLLTLAVATLASQGIFDADRWDILSDPVVWERLGIGLLATLRAAAVAAVLALLLGGALAAARLSRSRLARVVARVFTEFFRGLPVLLLMFFGLLAFQLTFFTAVVLGLALYNGAIIAEILRAGVLTLPRGQAEAGLAIGLTDRQNLTLIQFPQAVRIMLPSLLSQLVVLLKDTSLGSIVAYTELLRTVGILEDFFGSAYVFTLFFVGAGMYIALNFTLSSLATYLSKRQRKTSAAAPVEVQSTAGGA